MTSQPSNHSPVEQSPAKKTLTKQSEGQNGTSGPGPNRMVDLSVDLAPNNPHHLWLKNPVMIASGTFGYDGYGRGIIDAGEPDTSISASVSRNMDLSRLGAVIPKTVTRHAREGNPEPRWFPESYRKAWDAGDHLFLNSIGLTNPGIESAMRDLAPVWAQWDATVLLSLSADSVGQFSEMAAMIQGVAGFQAIELNLSCPNVADSALFSHSAALTREAVSAVKANTELPVLAKLAPNVPDITEIARAAVAGGADALTLANTMPAMRIDTVSRKPVLGNFTGGLSGMGMRPITLALVYQAAQAVDVPIIGVGGIFSGEHALEYILAGATAVQIGSANLVGLQAPWRVLAEFQGLVQASGVSSLEELRGAARPGTAI